MTDPTSPAVAAETDPQPSIGEVAHDAPTPPPAGGDQPIAPVSTAQPLGRRSFNWLAYVGLLAILAVGAYFRLVGLNWDDNQHLHPDERFMTSVASSISTGNLFDYFDTTASKLNPFPYGSYTYGMFPLFLTRFTAQLINQVDYDKLVLVGRTLSAVFDLAALVLLYILGARLYNRRVGLLAAALYAAAVLPIQLSHYFTVDSFATVFILGAFLTAESAMSDGRRRYYVIFGLMTGLAMACKINAAPIAGVIVLAAGLRLLRTRGESGQRRALLTQVGLGLLLAGAVAALTFRIFQPYAFNGPSIFGVSLNQRWLDIMREVTDQVAGNSEWPPNDHWTNRSQLTYAWEQNAVWGLGLPLGLAATIGWLWACWRIWRQASTDDRHGREWQSHLLLVIWVGAYFAWQNSQFWRYMRYFMPIYPLAILLAAWALLALYERFHALPVESIRQARQSTALRGLAAVLVAGVLLGTYGYAYAFTRIYTRPHSRVTASKWILGNIPGPLTLTINTPAGPVNQPLSVPYNQILKPGEPWQVQFQPQSTGTLGQIVAFRLRPPDAQAHFKITRDQAGADVVYDSQDAQLPADAPVPATVFLAKTNLAAGQAYYLQYSFKSAVPLTLDKLALALGDESTLPIDGQIPVAAGDSPTTGSVGFTPTHDLTFDRLTMGGVSWNYPAPSSQVRVTLIDTAASTAPLAEAQTSVDLSSPSTPVTFSLGAIAVDAARTYAVNLEVVSGSPLHPSGASLVMETSWDDSLPLRVNNYDPFGGIYVNTDLELFEPDTALKRDKIVSTLSQGDYLIVSSNRAYDAMPRLPLRFPVTLKYYQDLFNCAEQYIYKCAYPAQVGLESTFGYRLIAVFDSNPEIAGFQFSDQTAEEAFTVYDHPKVMIFQRESSFSASALSQDLHQVDLSQILDQAPRNYTALPTGLLLPTDRAAAQAANGTWSELFDPQSLLNTNQAAAVAAWYLLFCILGLAAFPLVFLALRGLPDHGYPLAKLSGLLIVTWLAWFTASYKLVMFSQIALWAWLGLLILVSAAVAVRRRTELVTFFKGQWRHILTVEAISLGLFLFFLWVRWLNPDLWHPWLGGEKPADFSFFQAIIRSVYFPPFDAWLSDHYVNYYYYGFVLCAVPTKMLGIIPPVAYNLAVPILFSLAGTGAFSVAYNLVAAEARWRSARSSEADSVAASPAQTNRPALLAGAVALTLMVLLGNLFEVRQLWQFLPEADDPPSPVSADIVQQITNVASGALRVISGQTGLPHDKGTWYFGPSRAIRHDGVDTPITEFPLFSFLYADLHPHLSSMGIMLLALAWMVSVVLAADRDAGKSGSAGPPHWLSLESIASLFLAGIVVGALQPTQTWDFPGFLLLGLCAILAANWLQRPAFSRPNVLRAGIEAAVFLALCIGLYYPFRQWFGTDFTSIELWSGARTPLMDYLTVHGLFLFITLSYLAWQSRAWPAIVRQRFPSDYLLNTPLGDLLPQAGLPAALIAFGFLAAVALAIKAMFDDYQSVVFTVILLVWLAVMFFQRGLSLPHRLHTAVVGVAVGLTLLVEFVTLKGDIGRSNTVFKFYIEAWLFFSVAAGAALAWLWPILRSQWPVSARRWWLGGLTVLGLAAASYTVIGIYTKVTDRWPNVDNPPHTLNGMAYMLGSGGGTPEGQIQKAIYDDDGSHYDLSQDYAAMWWMLQNVSGTPHIVEGTSPLYRWGSRFAIYTGLPTVVGWDWHVKQHDSVLPSSVVDDRIAAVKDFYDTTDPGVASGFLKKYDVGYVVVGGLERKYYQADGLAKFAGMAAAGALRQVFPVGSDPLPDQTVIYRVIEQAGN